MMWYGDGGGWGTGAWLPMLIFMLFFLGVAIWLVAMLTRSWFSRSQLHDHVQPVNEPKQILAERFARGEIDEEEFRRRKAVLDEKK